MATFLSSLGLFAALAQVPAAPAPAAPDSLSAVRARIAQDSGDGASWYQFGVGLLKIDLEGHGRHSPGDTIAALTLLDSADEAFRRAANLLAGTRRGDSARVFRAFTWGREALRAWESGGMDNATERWRSAPDDVRLPAVLEELGENLLRACPSGGVLIVRAGPDAQAATYLRMARHLRPDLTVVPFEVWRSDTVLQNRVASDLEWKGPGGANEAIARAVGRRPLCAGMGFEKPPDLPGGAHLDWKERTLVWVASGGKKTDTVPAQDFVFTALQLALDANDPWAIPALQVYRHAASVTPALCSTLQGFGVKDSAGCR